MVRRFRKWFVVTVSLFVTMFFMLLVQQPQAYYDNYSFANRTLGDKYDVIDFSQGKWRGLSAKQVDSLSKLGQILYLDYNPPIVDTTLKNYTILIWKYGPKLENRHIYHYTNQRFDPFENCSVKNCHITYKDDDLKTADLVLFHLYFTIGVEELPKGQRNPQQIWTFLTDESPLYTFRSSESSDYNGLFNWSMSYRMDTDIPVPYGRAVALKGGEKGTELQLDVWSKTKKQDVLVAIMITHCFLHNHRLLYVKELKKHIPVDMYGDCGTLKCPGHYTRDCDKISRYKFYLAFENSNCDEYITEKLWWNTFPKNVIPIVMGGSKTSYRQFLPPNSYINVEDFASPRDLANYILYLNDTPSELERYFNWKEHFKVLNEHGYFQSSSVHYCRICEALNYNSKKAKVYTDLKLFFNTDVCHKNWDAYSYNYIFIFILVFLFTILLTHVIRQYLYFLLKAVQRSNVFL